MEDRITEIVFNTSPVGYAGCQCGADRQLGEDAPSNRAAYFGDTLLYALHREFHLAGYTRGTRTEVPCTQTAFPSLPQMRYRLLMILIEGLQENLQE